MKTIRLTQGKSAIIDDSDFEAVTRWSWYAVRCGKKTTIFYAARSEWDFYNKRVKRIFMHCFLMGGKGVDHRDGNGLNNQRSNLRKASQSQNCRNRGLQKSTSSGFKGMTFHRRDKRFDAAIRPNGKPIHLGRFATAIEAAKCYDTAAEKFFGEFAKTNRSMGLLA